MGENIEVETRTFVSDEQYAAIMNILRRDFDIEKELNEVTVYFSGERDLRLRKDEDQAYLILKEGKIHDDFRKEFEIKLTREDFDNMKGFLESLGYEAEIEWRRRRFVYKKGEMKILLDDTEGYGKILELEEMAEEGGEKETHRRLLEEMKRLGVDEMTSREEFDRKFEYYKKNWKNLIR